MITPASPSLSAQSFCECAAACTKKGRYIVIDPKSKLVGTSSNPRFATTMCEITSFVNYLHSHADEIDQKSLQKLQVTFSKMKNENIKWYHFIFAIFSKKWDETLKMIPTLITQLENCCEQALERRKKEIKTYVLKHLTPYLNGSITAGTENTKRPKLILGLHKHLEERFTPELISNKAALEREALEIYTAISAENFLTMLDNPSPKDPRWPEYEKTFFYALQHAVFIDFSKECLDSFYLPDLARKMLQEKNFRLEHIN